MSLKLVSIPTVVGEGLSPPRSLLRVNPSPTSSRSRSLRSSAPKVSSWVCRSDEGLFDVELVTLSDNKGSSFKPFGDGKPPDIGGSPPKIFPLTYLSYFRISDIFAGNYAHHWIPPDLTRSSFSRRAHLGNDEDICNNTAFYCEDILNENQHSHYYEQIQNKARIREVFFCQNSHWLLICGYLWLHPNREVSKTLLLILKSGRQGLILAAGHKCCFDVLLFLAQARWTRLDNILLAPNPHADELHLHFYFQFIQRQVEK